MAWDMEHPFHSVSAENHLLSSAVSVSVFTLMPLYWEAESLLTERVTSGGQCMARCWSAAMWRLGLKSVGCSMLKSVGSKSSSMGASPSSISGSTLMLTGAGGAAWCCWACCCCCCCCRAGVGLVGLICWRSSDIFFMLFSSLGLRRNLKLLKFI